MNLYKSLLAQRIRNWNSLKNLYNHNLFSSKDGGRCINLDSQWEC